MPSDCSPSRVQPAGTVAVVAPFALTTSTSWSPGWTVAGITMDALAVVPLADAVARRSTWALSRATVTDLVVVAVPPSSSLTVSATSYVPSAA